MGLKLHGFFRRPLSSWRQRLLAKIHRIPSPTESRAVLAALTLGVRGALLSVDRERTAEKAHAFERVCGCWDCPHSLGEWTPPGPGRLAVLSCAGGALLHSAWLSQRWVVRRLAAALTIPLAIGYTALTGAELPTIRAACVLGLWLLATMLGRRTMLSHGLALSVLVIERRFLWVVRGGSANRAGSCRWLRRWGFRICVQSADVRHCSRLEPVARCWLSLSSGCGRRLMRRWRNHCDRPARRAVFGRFVATGIVANLVLVPIGELLVLPPGLLGLAIGSVTDWFGDPLLRLALAANIAACASDRTVCRTSTGLAGARATACLVCAVCARNDAVDLSASVGPRTLCARACGLRRRLAATENDLRLTALSVGQGDALVVEFPKNR